MNDREWEKFLYDILISQKCIVFFKIKTKNFITEAQLKSNLGFDVQKQDYFLIFTGVCDGKYECCALHFPRPTFSP